LEAELKPRYTQSSWDYALFFDAIRDQEFVLAAAEIQGLPYPEPKEQVSKRNIQKAKVILETMRASSSVNSTPRSGISNTSSVPNWMPSTYEFRLLNFEFPPQCSPAKLVKLRMKNLTLRSSYPGTFAQLSLEEQINEKFASVGERVRSYLDAVLSKHPPPP
jgi:hypothetical protein